MRIGMLLDAVFPPDPRVENEAVTLIASGHEVFLFCLNYGNEPIEEDINGIKVKRYQSSNLEYKLSALAYTVPLYNISLSKKIEIFLETHRIEIIHAHDIQLGGAVLRANKKLKLPLVVDLHENRPEIMKLYPHLNKIPGKFLINPEKWKIAEKHIIENSLYSIVVTEEAKKEILERCNVTDENIVVVPNTVHKSFYQETIIEQKLLDRYKNFFTILYLGDTGLRRGLMTAIESLPFLRKHIKNIKLVIVGTSSADKTLKNKVKELGLDDLVDFEGWKNVLLFPSYIKSSNLCISPLHANKHHETTYANKIFQYMSMEKPILASSVLAQENIISRAKSGMTHIPESFEDFSEKVLEMYADPKQLLVYGNNGKLFIENEFCWEKASQNLVDLYNNLSN